MADVVIVGAGIIGSSIALALRKRGAEVLLLEKAVVGAESSSAAAGMLAPHLEAHGPDAAFDLGVESLKLYPAWVESIVERAGGLDVGFRIDGAISLRDDLDVAWQRERGVRIETLERSDLVDLLPGLAEHHQRGLLFPHEAQVDPRRLMRALSFATERSGVARLTGATARRVSAHTVELEDRTVDASHVVVAAGAWTSLLPGVPLDQTSVGPARGQMLSLQGRPFGPYVWTGSGYLVCRRDGEILVGATVERVGFDKSVTAGGMSQLLTTALDAFPKLSSAPILRSWAGLRPWTSGAGPIIERIDGVCIATGHYRNGILLAPVTAERVADLIS